MNRIYKHYAFKSSKGQPATAVVSFSSYPGFLSSLDDFYIMDRCVSVYVASYPGPSHSPDNTAPGYEATVYAARLHPQDSRFYLGGRELVAPPWTVF